MKRVRQLVVAVCCVSLFAGAALANHASVPDGSSERTMLDIKRVNKHGGLNARWKVETYQAWSRNSIWDHGHLYLFIDTYGDPNPDYYALIRAGYERVVAALFDARTEERIRGLRLRRSSGTSVSVTVNLGNVKIGQSRTVMRWYVQSSWTSNKCWHVCFDWAPDTAKNGVYVEEPLPLE